MRIGFNVKVAKNIGEKSKETFGEVGTILYLKRILGTCITEFYVDDQYVFQVSLPIDTLEELNHYFKYQMYPEYHTLFKRIEED